MKKAAVLAIAEIVTDKELSADYVIPDAFHPGSSADSSRNASQKRQ